MKTIMIEFPSDQRIIDCLNTAYGIEVTTLTSLITGADRQASLYKAQAPDQLSYFVKLKQGHNHDRGAIIMELLRDAGIQQILPLIQTIQAHQTQRIDDFTLTVYPFIDGQDAFSRDLTDEQWINLGKVMKQIHTLEMPTSVQMRIRLESYSPKWRDAVRALITYIDSEPSADEIGLQFIRFMKTHKTAIHRLVNRAEQLALQVQGYSPEFVLCHSDVHGGNVLMDAMETFYIVDWDDPIMAPKERDLMFIGGGVANVWNKPHQTTLFYKGYGKTEVNRGILTYYRHERIVEDLALYGQELLFTGGQDRAISYKQVVAQFEARGAVEIAFKTDDALLHSKL